MNCKFEIQTKAKEKITRKINNNFNVKKVGDGTTNVVLLAAEFLREAKPFIEDGVHSQNFIKLIFYIIN